MLKRMVSRLGTRLLLLLLWCVHWLPLPLLRVLGRALGRVLYCFGVSRRRVALTNLALCFPQQSASERDALARRHFQAFACSVLDRTLSWWASPARLNRLIRVQGEENLQASPDQPLIILAPHFVGLDAGGTAVTMRVHICSMFSNQKNEILNQVLYDGRMRFKAPVLMSRQDGLRRIIKNLRQGIPFYYLPDMDFGAKESIFVPFFGVTTATTPALSRLCRITGARVVMCITRQVKDGYEIKISAPWQDFPGESVEADTVRMNEAIAKEIMTMPEQYFWLHKRFKTRPEGEAKVY